MMYKTKPALVEARQFKCDTRIGQAHIAGWCNGSLKGIALPIHEVELEIYSCEELRAEYGDWVIKNPFGVFYICKPEIFEETYELVED